MTSMHNRTSGGARGFTLIELVTGIVIGGILAAVAGPRFFTQTGYSQRGYTEELGAALRLAQKSAVASDCPTQVTLTASTYAVAQQAVSGNTCNPSDTTWSTPVIGMVPVAKPSSPNWTTSSATAAVMLSALIGRLPPKC